MKKIGKEKKFVTFGRSTKSGRSMMRPAKDVPKYMYQKVLQGNAGRRHQLNSTVQWPSSRKRETEQGEWDISPVRTQSTVLARAENARLVEKYVAVVKPMHSAIVLLKRELTIFYPKSRRLRIVDHRTKRRRTRMSALLIKPTEEKTCAEVLSEIRYEIKFKDSRVKVSSIRKMKDCRLIVELRTTNKSTFCETVKTLLGEKVLIPSLCALFKLKILTVLSKTSKWRTGE